MICQERVVEVDRINQIWPEWHTVELIGRGAFGEVYKAKREKLGEIFYSAVKVIRIPREEGEVREMLADGRTSQSIRYYYESIARGLMNEIKVMEVLKSAGNVVSIEEFDVREREDGIGWEAFIRMELLRNLNEYRQGREMSQKEIVKLGSDICEALICCEKSRIIHRDIKPSNIFVDVYGNFKLGDFGIARQMERTQSTLSQKGTEMYMAPEVRYGESGSSYNVDLYSLGLVMYRLLNGNRMPFEPADKEMISFQEREDALARRLRGEKLPLPAKADPALGRIIVKACEADRTKRYQDAEEMKEDLRLFSSRHGTAKGTAERTEAAEAVKAEAETRAGEQEEPVRSRGKTAAQFVEEETVSAFSERGQAHEVPKKAEANKNCQAEAHKAHQTEAHKTYKEEPYKNSPSREKADAAQGKYPKYPVNGKDVYVTKEVRRDQKYIYVKPEGAQFQRRIELPQEPQDGARICLSGDGEPGKNGGKNGDLFVIIRLTGTEKKGSAGQSATAGQKASVGQKTVGSQRTANGQKVSTGQKTAGSQNTAAGQKNSAGRKAAEEQNASTAQRMAFSANGKKRQRESTTGYKAATAAMVICVAVLYFYAKAKGTTAWEPMQAGILLFSQAIGLLLICIKNSKAGAVICMASAFLVGTIPMLLMDSVLHIFSEDHMLLVVVATFGTLALWGVLCTIPWIAANPGEKKKQTDK